MIRSDAGLASIEALPPDQAAGAHRQIGSLQDQRRAFSAQLQRDWSEMGSGSFQHLASNGATACEKDVIEGQGHQGSCHGTIPLFDPHHVVFEVL